MNAPRGVTVVVHTHWDREWYYTRERYAARTTRVFERVAALLESGAIPTFTLDGQTAAFEDFASVAEPALIARLRSLIAQGLIEVGPWYIAADEFLVAGESLLRNLEIGAADVAALTAHPQRPAGYLPDTFGHIAAMPMLLAEFGITFAVLWRGVDSQQAKFDWVAPDGTVMPTIYLPEGYYQHPLNVPDFAAALTRYLANVAPFSPEGPLLLTQGGDHLAPHGELVARIAEFNASQADYRLTVSTLAAYADAVFAARGAGVASPRARHCGALRSNPRAFVLPDVLSTRRYLKITHQRLEDELLRAVEPAWAIIAPVGTWPTRYFEHTWRTLIQQQAHDSICGCSIDAVHQAMEVRFADLAERLAILREQLEVVAGMVREAHYDESPNQPLEPFADDRQFTLINPLPHAAPGPHRVTLFLDAAGALPPLPPLPAPRVAVPVAPDALSFTTSAGQSVGAVVLSCRTAERFYSPLDEFPDRREGHEYEVAIDVTLPGLGAVALTVTGSAPALALNTEVAATALADTTVVANRYLRIRCEAGRLVLEDFESGQQIEDFLAVIAESDVGDSYTFSPPPHREVFRNSPWQVEARSERSGHSRAKLCTQLTMPASINASRIHRIGDVAVSRGELTIDLAPDSRTIEATLVWHNHVQDQRTRLVFRGLDAAPFTHKDTPFAWTEVADRYVAYPSEVTRAEMPVVVEPSHSVVVARPFWIAHRALHEYEVLAAQPDHGEGRRLAITLVRAVGWLSRRDLITRGVGAGPDMATPDAQCLRVTQDHFHFGLMRHDEPPLAALARARRLRSPALKLRGKPAANPFPPLTLADARLEVSSVRRVRVDATEYLELRLWNPHSSPLPTGFEAAHWQTVRADGTAASARDCRWVPAHGLLTVRRALA
jgi:mannosylglycerate hydrolase